MNMKIFKLFYFDLGLPLWFCSVGFGALMEGMPKALANSLLAATEDVFGLHFEVVDSVVSLSILAFTTDCEEADLDKKN
jgi:hypothetical protein